ncbi:MAG: zinc ribbon domain-containing protein [Candidatus Heimdallarchaeota archaeon]|nr:MAG: zinc ribbon domain-containing protein [Candidatus Heimdallarchaeota archaeon]
MSYDSPKTTPRFCGNCGQKLLEGATFCAYCGTQVPAIDSTGIPSSRPSTPSTSIPPTVTDRGVQAYQASYRPDRMITEPPLPFTQHFQGVLISPQLEMPRIAKRPNLKQPFLVVLIVGIIAGISSFLLFSKVTFSPQFAEDFIQSMGYSSDLIEGFDIESLMQTSLMMGAFVSPLGYIINWIIINSIVLWILHAIFSSQVPSQERNFKIMATIAGWSFLPLVFDELIYLLFVILFVPATTVNSFAELTALETFGSVGGMGIFLLFISLIFQIWSAILVYFASKSIDAKGYHAAIIAVLYAIVPYVISYLFSFVNPLGF